MKRTYPLFILLLFITTDLFAQNNSKITFTHNDYILIWHEGGMIRGTRVHGTIYCLTDSGLTCDTTHPRGFRPQDIGGLLPNVPVSASVYAKVKDMPYAITPEMLEKPESSYGKQEVDGGRSHVLGSINGKKYYWNFTSRIDLFPPGVQKFASYVYVCY